MFANILMGLSGLVMAKSNDETMRSVGAGLIVLSVARATKSEVI